MCMDLIKTKDLASCMDVLAQRILSIQRAKAQGGSWEKGEQIELTFTPGQSSAPSGLLKLSA